MFHGVLVDVSGSCFHDEVSPEALVSANGVVPVIACAIFSIVKSQRELQDVIRSARWGIVHWTKSVTFL